MVAVTTGFADSPDPVSANPDEGGGSRFLKRLGLVFGFGLVAAAVALYWLLAERPLTRSDADVLLQTATAYVDNGQTNLALPELQRVLDAFPDHHAARLLLAEVAILRRKGSEAASAIALLPDEFLESHFADAAGLARFMCDSAFLFEAEPLLKRLLAIVPDDESLRRELLRCYRISGQNTEAIPWLEVSLKAQRVDLSDLLMATAPLTNWASAKDVQFMMNRGQRHSDPLTMLGYGRRMIQSGQLVDAVAGLLSLADQTPDWQPGKTQLAMAFWKLGRDQELARVLSSWSPERLDDPNAWFLWGVWQLRQNEQDVAVRCFAEALQRDARHSGAGAQLVPILRQRGLVTEARDLSDYVAQLAQLDTLCLAARIGSPDPEPVRGIISGCRRLNWNREADAWSLYGRQNWPEIDWKDPSLNPPPAPGAGIVSVVLAELDFEQLPLPTRNLPTTSRGPGLASGGASSWRLDDEANAAGVRFQFESGLPADQTRTRIFDFSGPGVGVIDYDLDGWPDLHLTQGATSTPGTDSSAPRDELFRNRGDGSFSAAANLAGLDEPGFSQGPAVGDFNSDGFPDLFVCNMGPNRCFRNNGDGTFTEVTSETGMAGDEWSLSAGWADLNSDGHEDLYIVNYLGGYIAEHTCLNESGRSIQCSPALFPAAPDRLYLNSGEELFLDDTAKAGIDLPDGKGMGLVIGRFQDSSDLGVFVANDMTPNFLFVRRRSEGGGLHFENIGATAGVAFGPEGTAQSSMGVAAGDVDRDGRLDLFVTNFLAESSNLFLQVAESGFEDAANRFGLLAGGLLTEGWGAQFVDVDADGHLDLIVANGHLEEYNPDADRMPPQLFRNLNCERLQLVSERSLGSYFHRKYLGRAVASWDWDRDGREDVCISHTSDPVALLRNRTRSSSHRLRLRLVGTDSARTPIGTRVRVSVGDQARVRELVSGDGYTASNDRALFFGLGGAAEQVEIEVEWSRGSRQRFSGVRVDAEYLLIEGRAEPVTLTRYDISRFATVQ